MVLAGNKLGTGGQLEEVKNNSVGSSNPNSHKEGGDPESPVELINRKKNFDDDAEMLDVVDFTSMMRYMGST